MSAYVGIIARNNRQRRRRKFNLDKIGIVWTDLFHSEQEIGERQIRKVILNACISPSLYFIGLKYSNQFDQSIEYRLVSMYTHISSNRRNNLISSLFAYDIYI